MADGPISIDGATVCGIPPLAAPTAAVSLYGVNSAVFAPLHNAHMICLVIAVPVKKDNHPPPGPYSRPVPAAPGSELADAVLAVGKLVKAARFDVSALICTPADKAGAPVHGLVKAVPFPIKSAVTVTDLGFRNLRNSAVLGDVLMIAAVNNDEHCNQDGHGKDEGEEMCRQWNTPDYSSLEKLPLMDFVRPTPLHFPI